MTKFEKEITDDLEKLLEIIPEKIRVEIEKTGRKTELLEIVLDLGREPEVRFNKDFAYLNLPPITTEEIDYVLKRVGDFGKDSRAGIERTLHRISGIRNRRGKIIGLTCRVGRAIQGTVDIIRDLVESGRSILMLGIPGIGKTTKLREIARILSSELRKRVIVIDTSNEIAGDGDIPHPAIGRARRMQVDLPENQHAVMIEAVENHMPEVIIIDEISTEIEALAARTIAERGVQLIGTAHGNSIENLIMNPSLNDLVGGIQTVTLGDEEAKRRGTQKTVQERKSPPTFDIVIELQDRYRLAVHPDVSEAVDQYLRGSLSAFEIRSIDEKGNVKVSQQNNRPLKKHIENNLIGDSSEEIKIYPYAVSRSQLERIMKGLRVSARVTKNLEDADMIFVLKSYAKANNKVLKWAENKQVPLHIVKNNNVYQIQKTLREALQIDDIEEEFNKIEDEIEEALQEVDEAMETIKHVAVPIDLLPRNEDILKMQQKVVQKNDFVFEVVGIETEKRLRIYPNNKKGRN
ncbi:MAG: AAA family ATPase [Candidatus Sericytochromatia bacterium]